MVFPHALLWREVTEDVILLLIISSHALLDALLGNSSQKIRVFQQPARRANASPMAWVA